MYALRRDSSVTEEELDEYQIGQLYESQLVQLEKLIAVQRRSHLRAKNVSGTQEVSHITELLLIVLSACTCSDNEPVLISWKIFLFCEKEVDGLVFCNYTFILVSQQEAKGQIRPLRKICIRIHVFTCIVL